MLFKQMNGTWKMNGTWSFLPFFFFLLLKCQWGVSHWIPKQQGHIGTSSGCPHLLKTVGHHKYQRQHREQTPAFRRAASCRSMLAAGIRRHFALNWDSVCCVAVQRESRDLSKTLGWPTLPTAVNIWPPGLASLYTYAAIYFYTVLLRIPTQNEAAWLKEEIYSGSQMRRKAS